MSGVAEGYLLDKSFHNTLVLAGDTLILIDFTRKGKDGKGPFWREYPLRGRSFRDFLLTGRFKRLGRIYKGFCPALNAIKRLGDEPIICSEAFSLQVERHPEYEGVTVAITGSCNSKLRRGKDGRVICFSSQGKIMDACKCLRRGDQLF